MAVSGRRVGSRTIGPKISRFLLSANLFILHLLWASLDVTDPCVFDSSDTDTALTGGDDDVVSFESFPQESV